MCKKYYTQQQFSDYLSYISIAMSKFNDQINNKIYFSYCLDEMTVISIYELNLFLLKENHLLESNKLHYLIKYHELIPIFFKVDNNKQLLVSNLVVNNISSLNIDRCNINFLYIKQKLSNIYNKCNFYYYNVQDKYLDDQINLHYSKRDNYINYTIHEYELKNKIKIPMQKATMNPTPSRPTEFPLFTDLPKYNKFISQTADFIIPLVRPPVYYDPFDLKHTKVPQDYFKNVVIKYYEPPPIVTYKEAVSDKEKLFPNKKYILYNQYKNIRCHFCRKLGHPMKWCEDLTIVDDIKNPLIKRLVNFILKYPICKIKQKFDSYSRLILELPDEYEKLVQRRNKFWSDYGYDNPFSNCLKDWSFGYYRRRDVGFNWAIGASRVTMVKLVVGYESKYCVPVPRMQLLNHKAWDTSNPKIVELITELIIKGIMIIIPKWLANVILPLNVILKEDKTRIVVDAKPTNIYIPSMRFKPSPVEEVKYAIFPECLALTQDGKHAFLQLPVTVEQSLMQCACFYYPPLKCEITVAFTTEIFGSNLSCRRFIMQENQINKYLAAMGIQLTKYYDDTIFYVQNSPLFAAIAGSFIKRIYYHTGRQLREHKTDLLKGSYEFKYRGFLWNSLKMTVQPLPRLIISTVEKIKKFENHENKNIQIKELMSVMGKLSYVTLVIPYMSILLTPLKDIMRFLHNKYDQDVIWAKTFKVTPSLISHLKYLMKILQKNHITFIVVNNIDVEIVTDASDRLLGSYDSFGRKIVVPIPEQYKLKSSTCRETYGVYIALLNRLSLLKNKNVRILVDNLGTSTILMRNGSKIFDLKQLVYKIIKLCINNKIILWSRWLRRSNEAIQFADDLSKSVEEDRWIFDLNLFKLCQKALRLSYPHIDLLADSYNKICDNYFSRFYDDFSLGVNWMQYSYKIFKNKICYINPPFRGDYLQMTLNHIVSKRINTYVILPKWPLATWYRIMLQYASIIVEFKEGYKYFKSPQYMTLRLSKKWDVLLVYFDFSFQQLKFYFYNEHTMRLVPR